MSDSYTLVFLALAFTTTGGARAQAVEVDAPVPTGGGERVAPSISEEPTPARRLAEPVGIFTAPEPLPEITLVDISLTGAVRRRIQVFERGGKGTNVLAAECEAPCTLPLAPARYAFSSGYSTVSELAIPSAPHRSLRLDVRSHEELRIAGWSLVGASVIGALAFTVASATLEIDDPLVSIPTVLGLGALLIVGVVLGLWPDEVSASLAF